MDEKMKVMNTEVQDLKKRYDQAAKESKEDVMGPLFKLNNEFNGF